MFTLLRIYYIIQTMTNYEHIRLKLSTILDKPGIYKMLDVQGNILYIGKSITLKKRITSYLAKEVNRNDKIKQMLKRLWDVEVYYTDTELDALLLECKWIQKYKPPYNTAMMYPQKYGYFLMYDAPHYTFKWSKDMDEGADLIIGPITHRSIARGAYDYFKSHYPYLCCDKKKHDCIYYLVDKCVGYCEVPIASAVLQEIHTLLDKHNPLEETLIKEMNNLSEKWEFEKAKVVYEQLKGMKYIRRLYGLTEEMKKETYIGRLPIPHTFYYKYYLVRGGEVVYTLKGPYSSEPQIIKQMKAYKRDYNIVQDNIQKDEIDFIRVLYTFKHKKMQLIEV